MLYFPLPRHPLIQRYDEFLAFIHSSNSTDLEKVPPALYHYSDLLSAERLDSMSFFVKWIVLIARQVSLN